MTIPRKAADAFYRNDFGAFVYAAFGVLHPGQHIMSNWHIDAVCFQLQEMVMGRHRGRLVLNQPPRTLKSFMVSVCLPAWVLGRRPGARIICASYSEDLAHKFSRDCRTLIESPLYKRIFPRTRLNPKKATEGEFETTQHGCRFATSVGGTLTGRGGEVLIVDDPIKAIDANSQVALEGAFEWFCNTAFSRLDNPKESLIILTQQRLHAGDLSGLLIEQEWPHLVLPAIATESADYLVGPGEVYHRPAGELLQPIRDSRESLEETKRQVGSRIFASQYQQNPLPAEGNVIKAAWLVRYELSPKLPSFRRVVLACDPAGKAGVRNDYTAIVVAGVAEKTIHILHVARGHWSVMAMQQKILGLASEWKVDLNIIEDTASGMGLIQLLKECSSLDVIGLHPKADKATRMARHEGRFEAQRIMLPKEAPWLADFESELLAFPNGRYDDQVDALLLFLDWFAEHKYYEEPTICAISVGRGPRPWSREYPPEWSF